MKLFYTFVLFLCSIAQIVNTISPAPLPGVIYNNPFCKRLIPAFNNIRECEQYPYQDEKPRHRVKRGIMDKNDNVHSFDMNGNTKLPYKNDRDLKLKKDNQSNNQENNPYKKKVIKRDDNKINNKNNIGINLLTKQPSIIDINRNMNSIIPQKIKLDKRLSGIEIDFENNNKKVNNNNIVNEEKFEDILKAVNKKKDDINKKSKRHTHGPGSNGKPIRIRILNRPKKSVGKKKDSLIRVVVRYPDINKKYSYNYDKHSFKKCNDVDNYIGPNSCDDFDSYDEFTYDGCHLYNNCYEDDSDDTHGSEDDEYDEGEDELAVAEIKRCLERCGSLAEIFLDLDSVTGLVGLGGGGGGSDCSEGKCGGGKKSSIPSLGLNLNAKVKNDRFLRRIDKDELNREKMRHAHSKKQIYDDSQHEDDDDDEDNDDDDDDDDVDEIPSEEEIEENILKLLQHIGIDQIMETHNTDEEHDEETDEIIEEELQPRERKSKKNSNKTNQKPKSNEKNDSKENQPTYKRETVEAIDSKPIKNDTDLKETKSLPPDLMQLITDYYFKDLDKSNEKNKEEESSNSKNNNNYNYFNNPMQNNNQKSTTPNYSLPDLSIPREKFPRNIKENQEKIPNIPQEQTSDSSFVYDIMQNTYKSNPSNPTYSTNYQQLIEELKRYETTTTPTPIPSPSPSPSPSFNYDDFKETIRKNSNQERSVDNIPSPYNYDYQSNIDSKLKYDETMYKNQKIAEEKHLTSINDYRLPTNRIDKNISPQDFDEITKYIFQSSFSDTDTKEDDIKSPEINTDLINNYSNINQNNRIAQTSNTDTNSAANEFSSFGIHNIDFYESDQYRKYQQNKQNENLMINNINNNYNNNENIKREDIDVTSIINDLIRMDNIGGNRNKRGHGHVDEDEKENVLNVQEIMQMKNVPFVKNSICNPYENIDDSKYNKCIVERKIYTPVPAIKASDTNFGLFVNRQIPETPSINPFERKLRRSVLF